MNVKKLLFVAPTLFAASVLAQATLGTVVNVEGVATATTGGTAAPVTVGTPIREGTRVVTTSGSRVTIRLNNGCVVNLLPGQGVTVAQTLSCQQLAAAVQPVATVTTVTPPVRVPPTGFGPVFTAGGGGGLAALGVIGLAAVIINNADDDESISPN